MRYLLSSLLVLAWGLWLGGLITLFMAVSSVFATLAPDRSHAGSITAPIFGLFERYQLVLAGVAIVAVIGMRLLSCSRTKKILLAVLLLAGTLAVVQTALISSRMENLRLEGQGSAPEFRKLHGISMAMYGGTTLLLLGGGLLLPRTLREDAETIIVRPATKEPVAAGSQPESAPLHG